MEMARLKDEDTLLDTASLLKNASSTSAASQSGDDFSTENYSQVMDERRTSYVNNCIPQMEIDEGSLILQGREKSATLYAKKRDEETTLDDFVFRKVIGQGSFGKVYMVQHKCSGKTYAMKSIRKDVVIDSEQLENLRLEKHIMLCVEHPFLISMEYVFQRELRIYFLMDFIR